MNNRQTSRRRGRGNNRAQNNNRNGYDHQNRIDNRARGNAAQMLEKYKKLAQDAQLNGDRVQAEYYHQFADHYFRVLADFRSRQEESRPQRSEWRNDDREGGDWREDERDGDPAEAVDEESDGAEIESDLRQGDDEDRRPQRNDRRDRNDRGNNRNRRDRNDRNDRQQPRESEAPDLGLDLAALPPAIGAANDEDEIVVAEKPVRKPRARKPKLSEGETVAAE
ncbi:DUF4167 domain-containing protein [Sphingorhabdus sp.]|jgi:hypothetical protein|uniref:DUF4167 domain-containing protein n=1 Tax=Sphingorhabdus sp. TaxID=1902408 RepID=UPI0035B33CA8|nr:DUF4167 domain-containing protein [Sphingomonadaceae bacterium]